MPQTVAVPDYVSAAAGRGLEWHREGKSGDGVTDQTLREARDKTLGMPKLILPSIQVNMRAGKLPPAEANGVHYLKVPITLPN